MGKGLKESHLTQFASKRLDSLKDVDQVAYPVESLLEGAQGVESKLSPVLKRGKGQCPNVLFEVKKASPTLGQISEVDALELCSSFVEKGAKAISVLVDPVNFGGHPDDLKTCVNAFGQIPFLWKDFVMGEYQVRLAKHLGASSVLLMTQLLEGELLKDLFALAKELGIEAFVETHDIDQFEFALSLGAQFIGINARDFETPGLPIHLNTASGILQKVGDDVLKNIVVVAQSGIATVADLNSVLEGMPKHKPDAVQIGSSLSGKGLPQDLQQALGLKA